MTDETPQAPPAEPAEQVVEPVIEQQAPDDAGQPEDKPKGGGFQKRIKELADERNYWRELAMRQPPEPRAPEPPKAAEPAKLPKLEDFQYDEAQYQAALLEHATKHAETIVEKRLAERESQWAERHRLSTFQERIAAFAKTQPEFMDKVMRDPTLPITAAMRDVIVDSEIGPEIATWLADNREQAERIAGLPPHLAALEVARIEGRMSATKEAKSKPVQVTQAPPPPPSVEAVEPEVNEDPDKMPMDKWLKWREKSLKKSAPPWARR